MNRGGPTGLIVELLVAVFDVVSATAPDPLLVEALGPEGSGTAAG